MMWAAENGHNECLSLLLESDASPRIADNDGFTALHRAVSSPYHLSTIYIEFMIFKNHNEIPLKSINFSTKN